MIERVPYYGWPRPTPTNSERTEAWRRKYRLVPIEAQCAPFDRLNPLDIGGGAVTHKSQWIGCLWFIATFVIAILLITIAQTRI